MEFKGTRELDCETNKSSSLGDIEIIRKSWLQEWSADIRAVIVLKGDLVSGFRRDREDIRKAKTHLLFTSITCFFCLLDLLETVTYILKGVDLTE